MQRHHQPRAMDVHALPRTEAREGGGGAATGNDGMTWKACKRGKDGRYQAKMEKSRVQFVGTFGRRIQPRTRRWIPWTCLHIDSGGSTIFLVVDVEACDAESTNVDEPMGIESWNNPRFSTRVHRG